MINREVSYDRNMLGSYMKIPEGIHAGIDERLMLRRKLQGTLPVEKNYVDGNGQYWYNISGKQSLDTYCRVKDIGIEFVERLVISICNELEILERNLVHTNCLMLDPELVFITNGNREFIFTLYPGNNSQIEVEFQQLMEYLLTKINHKDDAAVKAAYGIYEKTLEEGYSVLDIRETIVQSKQQAIARTGDEQLSMRQEMRKQSAAKIYNSNEAREIDLGRNSPQNVPYAKRRADERTEEGIGEKDRPWHQLLQVFHIKELQKKLSGFFQKEQKEETPLVFPEEEIYVPKEEIHPTICLGSYQGGTRGVLVYLGSEGLKDIVLDAKVTKIGHGADADARIDRETVSQLHAKIDRDEECFYIEDLNSTNGTFVNEEALVYKERRQLKINDIVCFADIRYRFC